MSVRIGSIVMHCSEFERTVAFLAGRPPLCA